MSADDDRSFLRAAIDLALENVLRGGRPFGAVVVRRGAIIATGVNAILDTNDPTAHAEMEAIRAASRTLGSPDLSGCAVYASGHPCPMCMAAMRMAGVGAVTFAYGNEEAEPFGLSTAAIYADLARPFAEQSMRIRHLAAEDADMPALYVEWRRGQGAA
ncbi:MAG: nucleoside deaminase [Sphingomonas bacterium]